MVKMAELTVETASLGSVGVEEAERDNDDEEETGDHHGDYSCHGNRFYFDTGEKAQRVRHFDAFQIQYDFPKKYKKRKMLFFTPKNPSRQAEKKRKNIKHVIEYNHNIVRGPQKSPAPLM
jgi:hypothetical protein